MNGSYMDTFRCAIIIFIINTVFNVTFHFGFGTGAAVSAGGILDLRHLVRKTVTECFAAFVRFTAVVDFNVVSRASAVCVEYAFYYITVDTGHNNLLID